MFSSPIEAILLRSMLFSLYMSVRLAISFCYGAKNSATLAQNSVNTVSMTVGKIASSITVRSQDFS
jgi:hypothetical protein